MMRSFEADIERVSLNAPEKPEQRGAFDGYGDCALELLHGKGRTFH
jgi:hypothetical protein